MNPYELINNIYTRPGNRTFGYSDGDAVENYLLSCIRAAADVSTGSAELAAAIRDWPSMYHLSPRRADLLRPLAPLLQRNCGDGHPAPGNSASGNPTAGNPVKVLEIGCGCGAITRFLGELGCEVTALEGSEKRALIARERCRHQQNVRVICDNFSDFQWEEQFDIVLLVGVLEYSRQFMEGTGNNAPLAMLRRAKNYLRPEGQLILAIENQLGLKYWAGAPEDHTGRPFDGIEDRYTSDTAVTFGRSALTRLLSDAGFPLQEFLYPFPDYKLPEVIVKEPAFSAAGLDLGNLLHEKFDYLHASGEATEFSPTRAAAVVMENKLMPDLSNSFLVITGHGDQPALPPDNTLVYTYNSVRQKPYCKSNLIIQTPEGLKVIRRRLYPETPLSLTGSGHGQDQPLKHHILDEDYHPGRLLSTYAPGIVTRPGWTLADLGAWAERYYHILTRYADGASGLNGRYIDLTPFNILITEDGQELVFDQEWECPDNIPVYFVFFRGLVYTLDKISHYAPPAEGTPTGLISLVSALTGMFMPFDDTHREDCVRLEEKYFHALPLMPGRPFSHGSIRLKTNLHSKLVETQARLENTLREYAALQLQSQQQAARIRQDHQSHIAMLHQQIEWYHKTYEQRSIPGLLLQRRLSQAQADQKYLSAHLLTSMQEKGTVATLSLILKALFSRGLKGLFHPRKALMPLMRTPLAPAPVKNISLQEAEDPVKALAGMQTFTIRPKISLIMPVYNTDPRWLEVAVDSIRQQWYDNWQLCIADDGSTRRETQQMLHRLTHLSDPRINIIRLEKNAGISEASNAAIAMSDGYYIALMDHDDELTPDALYQVAKDLNLYGEADILYTDECKVDEDGQLSDPFFKPSYSAELLLNMMYPGHLTVYKREFLLNKVGLFRKEYDLSQDYDLMLRAVEQTTHIRHIEKIVYRWRMTAGSSSQGEKPHARITNLAALKDALSRRNIPAEVIELPTANRVRLHIDPQPLVSIIIPTDSRDNLRETLESIYLRTGYRNFEVVVVTNSRLIADPPGSGQIPADPSGANPGSHSGTNPGYHFGTTSSFGSQAPPVYVPYDKPYNFSDKCNHGALQARGEILIFLNDDVRPLQDDWLENTIEYLLIPGVGGVSPKLVYEDDSIQYAGMATGVRGLTGTTFHGYPKDSTAYINFPQSVRNVSILSGACLAIKKDIFLRVGGFDKVNTPSSHSDVDLSFKLLDAGHRLVYTPYATLRHIGHLSLKEYEDSPASRAKKDKADIFLLRRWAQRVADDPYFTLSMRNYLYHDSPEPYRIYAPPADRENWPDGRTAGRDILLVSHDLSLSGAPVMLLQLCRLLIRSGYFVTVICEKEGPIGKMFLQSGAPVIIDSLVLRQHETLARFARNFDHVICNTIVTWPAVQQLGGLTHTIWWLHEAKIIETFAEDPAFVETLSKARNVVGPSEYALHYIRKFNPHPQKIYYGYPGILPIQPQPAAGTGKLIFSLVGSIEPRKGQDILVGALKQLDAALLNHIEVWIIGRPHDPNFHNEVLQIIRHFPNIKIIGECDHQQCLDLMAASDVILCPSRDDPFPVVIVEALCLSKPCIVSSNTGFAELMTDGANGYVIPGEDSNALAIKISRIVKHPQDLVPIRHAARQLYEKYITMETFREKFLALLSPAEQEQPASAKQKQKTLQCQD